MNQSPRQWPDPGWIIRTNDAWPKQRTLQTERSWPQTSDLWLRAGHIPSLDLRFAESKTLNDAVTGQNLITFTRASTGTYVAGDGLLKTAAVNEPRFDHNPTTGESLGLLVEEARTNTLTDSMPTTSGGTGITNTLATGLPGIFSTGRRLAANNSGSDQRITIGIATSGSTFAYSFFARLGSQGDSIFLRLGTSSFATWNLSSASVTRDDFGTSKIINYGNGWYRCYSIITGNGQGFLVGIGSNLYATAGDNIIIAGVQAEVATYPSSYIPTSGATVTRSADVASITGAAFSSWYRQDEGTVFIDAAEPSAYVPFQAYLTLQGNSNIDEIRFWRNGTTFASFTHLINNVQVGSVSLTLSLVANRFATNYSVAQGIAASANGGNILTSALTDTVPATLLRIGARVNNVYYGNRTYKRITYWPQRLPNRILQALTR